MRSPVDETHDLAAQHGYVFGVVATRTREGAELPDPGWWLREEGYAVDQAQRVAAEGALLAWCTASTVHELATPSLAQAVVGRDPGDSSLAVLIALESRPAASDWIRRTLAVHALRLAAEGGATTAVAPEPSADTAALGFAPTRGALLPVADLRVGPERRALLRSLSAR